MHEAQPRTESPSVFGLKPPPLPTSVTSAHVCKHFKAAKGRSLGEARNLLSKEDPSVSSRFLPPITQADKPTQLQVHLTKKA